MGSIEWNRLMWGNIDNWSASGDCWDFHAKSCGQPYEDWKNSVVTEFVTPYLGPAVDVVEIGPGQGRWTQYIVAQARTVALVDLSSNCIDVCRRRFVEVRDPELSFFVNDGKSLPVSEASVDLVWSFGTFVHVELAEIDQYLSEIRRVLRPGGRFVIHHADRGDHGGDENLDGQGGTEGGPGSPDTRGDSLDAGLRSEVSARQFSKSIASHDLVLDQQIRNWGPIREFGLAFGDVLSLGSRPH